MRASGVNAAILRVIEKLKKKRAIAIARIEVARITGIYCIHMNTYIYIYSYII